MIFESDAVRVGKQNTRGDGNKGKPENYRTFLLMFVLKCGLNGSKKYVFV